MTVGWKVSWPPGQGNCVQKLNYGLIAYNESHTAVR